MSSPEVEKTDSSKMSKFPSKPCKLLDAQSFEDTSGTDSIRRNGEKLSLLAKLFDCKHVRGKVARLIQGRNVVAEIVSGRFDEMLNYVEVGVDLLMVFKNCVRALFVLFDLLHDPQRVSDTDRPSSMDYRSSEGI